MIETNDIEADEVASAFFTTTTDLNAGVPSGGREADGVVTPPPLRAQMYVPGSLPLCVRILSSCEH